MKYITPLVAGILVGALVMSFFVPKSNNTLGAPATEAIFQKNLIPVSDSLYTLGTTSKAWLNVYTDELCIAGDCKVAWPAATSKWTDAGAYIYPTGGEYVSFPYLVSTSTATSTFAGGVSLGLNQHIVAHGAVADGSDGFHIDSYNGTMSANFGAGGGANATFYDGVTVTGVLSANGNLTTPFGTSTTFYAGTSTLTNATTTDSFFGVLGTFTDAIINTLLTTASAVITSALQIPNGTGPTVDATGEIAVDTTSDQLIYYGASSKKVLTGNDYTTFTYATTTAWTGTTTLPLGPAIVAETWNSISCFTDAGTLYVSVGDGTNYTNTTNASTTVGLTTLSSNNTFTAGEKRYFRAGTPASSPTTVSCTISRSITAD